MFVQSLDAPVPLSLTPESMLAKYPFWGPDSREVHFIRFRSNRAGSMRDGSLWKVSAAGGEPSLVQPEAHYATISPGGRTVASLRMIQQPRSFRLWTATPPQATPQPYEPAPFQGKFYINAPNVQFAPDGKKILIAANPDSPGEQVWLVPWPPGPGRRILQGLPGYGGTPQFSWMPDSRHVVLAQRTDRRQPYRILLADTVTSKWWPIHANERNAVWPDASPDGTSVAYVSDLSNMDVVEVPVDGGPPRTFAGSSRHESMPTYSPDGRIIVYVTDRRGVDELWAENLQDRRSWPVLTPSDFQSPGGPPFLFIAPAFSPDGQRIAVTSANNAGGVIYVTGFETPAPVRLTAEEAFEQPPAWSPHGQWIAYYRMRPQRLRTLAKAKLGSSAPPVDLIENVDMSVLPEWSPTAEWISCAIVDKPGITLVSPEGKPSRFLPGVSRPMAWSRDGKTIYQVRGAWDSALVAIDILSGKERVIRDLGPLRPNSLVTGGWRVSASPDGKNLAWSVMRLRTEIWLLQGLRLLPPWYASLFEFR